MRELSRLSHNRSPQEIIVSIDEKSVRSLVESKASLMIFKAVSNSDAATRPLLWARTSRISLKMYVTIGPEVSFFTSTQTALKDGKLITATTEKKGEIGEVFEIRAGTGGDGVVKETGAPLHYSYRNPTSAPFLCGLMQSVDGMNAPYCCAPLHGNSSESFSLSKKVLLAFSSGTTSPGTVITTLDQVQGNKPSNAFVSDIVTIDLGNADLRKVSFDIDRGWNWRSNVWGQGYSSVVNLTEILVF